MPKPHAKSKHVASILKRQERIEELRLRIQRITNEIRKLDNERLALFNGLNGTQLSELSKLSGTKYTEE